ncbi:unnamed protein product [Gordionus sp. m RMFG-2023]
MDFFVCFTLIIIPFWIWKCNSELMESLNSKYALKNWSISSNFLSYGCYNNTTITYDEDNLHKFLVNLSLQSNYSKSLENAQSNYLRKETLLHNICFDPKSYSFLQILNALLPTFIYCSNSLRLAMSIDRLTAMTWPFIYQRFAKNHYPKFLVSGIVGFTLIFIPLNYFYFNLEYFKTLLPFSDEYFLTNDVLNIRESLLVEGMPEFNKKMNKFYLNQKCFDLLISLPYLHKYYNSIVIVGNFNSFKIFNKIVNILFFIFPMVISTFANMSVIYILRQNNLKHLKIFPSNTLTKSEIIDNSSPNHHIPSASDQVELQCVKLHSNNPFVRNKRPLNPKIIKNNSPIPENSILPYETSTSTYSSQIVSSLKSNFIIGSFPKLNLYFNKIKIFRNSNDGRIKQLKSKDLKIILLMIGLSIEFFVLMMPLIVTIFIGYPPPNLFQILKFNSIYFAEVPSLQLMSKFNVNSSQYFNSEYDYLSENPTLQSNYKIAPIVYILWYANHALSVYVKFALDPTVNHIIIEMITKFKRRFESNFS